MESFFHANRLYLFCAITACLLTSLAVPFIIHFFGRFLTDKPTTLKNHSGAVPMAGGPAVALGLWGSLVIVRLFVSFPSGTLHSLRGLLFGGFIIFVLGIVDDILKPKGLTALTKLLGQAVAAGAVIAYGMKIQFIACEPLSLALTFLWIIGLTNAFNLLDIMDGLCVSTGVITAFFFLIVALPGEHIYVNFAAAAILGACIAFWPYNHSSKQKSFLGDSGSMLIGFTLAGIALGTSYTSPSNLGVYAPVLILAVPIFDTAFVFIARILKGKNPLKASPDHMFLRIRRKGLSVKAVLALSIAANILYGLAALMVLHVSFTLAAVIYAIIIIDWIFGAVFLLRMENENN